ncbi:MAG: hypothetical protein U0414_38940 [Polyangiaceae bacterium]
MKRFGVVLVAAVGVASFALGGCAVDPGDASVDESDAQGEAEQLGSTAEALSNPIIPPEVLYALTHPGSVTQADLDLVRHAEHRVNIGGGKKIAMTETYTLRSWLRFPHRAMLMITAQGSNRAVYNAPFEGYDGGAILASDGFFAFSADPQGTSDSSQPADGLTVTYDSETQDFLKALDYIRLTRLVPKVDVLGEEIGGGVAMQLAADNSRVRSCVAASMIYKTGSDFFNAVFNSPEFKGFLFGSPDGYFQTFPGAYFNVVAGASPEVANWFINTQVGRYAAGTYKEDYERLFEGGDSYDPTHARVPGLLIRGELDPNNSIDDVVALANAYGSAVHHHGPGPAEVAVIERGSHIVRIDAAPRGPQFWDLVLDFVD